MTEWWEKESNKGNLLDLEERCEEQDDFKKC